MSKSFIITIVFSFFVIKLNAQNIYFSQNFNGPDTSITFPAVISDNMVLQRESVVPIWGKLKPNTAVNINCSWDNSNYQTTSGADGKWSLQINTPVAGGPFTMQVNNRQINNILIGEVWVCSGQSNMQLSLSQTENGLVEASNASLPNIRLFSVTRELALTPQDNCRGSWVSCSPTVAGAFSAVAYYFGKKLHQQLNVPIGLINTSYGSSTAQAWVKDSLLKQDTSYNCYYAKELQKSSSDQASPSLLYNAMLHPIIPYAIKGVIWYQGEANTNYCANDPNRYLKLFPLLINSWRDEWKQGAFPFYYVQIAPYNYNLSKAGAFLRDAQRRTLSVANTGMAVTLDIGDTTNIHPLNKVDVGNRLAYWALSKNYGMSNLVYSGPLYNSLSISGNKATVSFTEIGSGLVAKNGVLNNFEIAGANKIFYPAVAVIDGATVVVSSTSVSNPVSVRYAFSNTSIASLFNLEGLPASSFTTDDW